MNKLTSHKSYPGKITIKYEDYSTGQEKTDNLLDKFKRFVKHIFASKNQICYTNKSGQHISTGISIVDIKKFVKKWPYQKKDKYLLKAGNYQEKATDSLARLLNQHSSINGQNIKLLDKGNILILAQMVNDGANMKDLVDLAKEMIEDKQKEMIKDKQKEIHSKKVNTLHDKEVQFVKRQNELNLQKLEKLENEKNIKNLEELDSEWKKL